MATSIRDYLEFSSLYELSKNSKYDAVIDPTVSNDDTQGYVVGSIWINTAAHRTFTCSDNSTGSAVWVDNTATAGAMTYIGGYDANTNTPDLDTAPSGIQKGDTYTVTVAGTFFTTEDVEPGDVLIAEQDDPTLLTHWTVVQANLTPATIKSQYESNADTNAFTDSFQSQVTANTAKVSADGSVSTHSDVDIAGIINESLIQWTGSELNELVPTDGVVKINEVMEGITAIGLTPVVVKPGGTYPDDEYNLVFSSITDFPNNVANEQPLTSKGGRTLIDTFVEGVDLTAPGPDTADLSQDIGDGVTNYHLEVTRETTGSPGVELGLIEGTDFSISYGTGGGGADQITINSLASNDTIRVYTSFANKIYNPEYHTWVENDRDLQLNIWRVLVYYTKSGTQSGNTLVVRFWNPNPASSFAEVVTFAMPGGATFQSNSVQFVFLTVGDNLSIPGTVTTVYEPQYTVGTSITLGVAKTLVTKVGDTIDPKYPVRVYKNGVTLLNGGGDDYTITYNDYPTADQLTVLAGGTNNVQNGDTIDLEVDGEGFGYRMTLEVLGGNTMDINSMSISRFNGIKT